MADAEGKLKSAEKELSKMVSHSQMMENRYKEVRTKAAKARDEYTRLKAGYDKEFEKQTARLEELKQERADAAQGIDEAYMERYKAIRSQRFPVLASLRNDPSARGATCRSPRPWPSSSRAATRSSSAKTAGASSTSRMRRRRRNKSRFSLFSEG